MPTVYKTKEATPKGLTHVCGALGVSLKGNTAIRVSTGEPGGCNSLQPGLVKDLVNRLSGTIVECSTAYPGRRNTAQTHWGTIRNHGLLAIAPCDILGEDSGMATPVESGFHLQENYVGTHLKNYDSMVMLSHSRGHAMGGFGGALKSMSIGFAPSRGKIQIHISGTSNVFEDAFTVDHDSLLESMTNANRSAMDLMGHEKIVCINVANRLPVGRDCDIHPHDPEMADIGIFASADPAASDRTSVDAVCSSEDAGKRAPIEHMESRYGIHTVGAVQVHGLGNHRYELVCIG